MSNNTNNKATSRTELVKQFLEIAHIPLAYNEEAKERFHQLGKIVLKQIAKDLGYDSSMYDLRSNKAGIAVSGEINLHTVDDLYVQFSQSAGDERYNIIYRSCSHRRDYTGGSNHFLPFSALKKYDNVLRCFQQVRQEALITRSRRIARLNDQCRRAMGVAGRLVQTEGINAMSPEDQSAIREKVEKFDDFSEDNDPYGERDFGAFDHNGQKIFWKIDYYDRTLTYGSENPADPKQTVRALTIMLADEY